MEKPDHRSAKGLAALAGIEVLELAEERAAARMPVTDAIRQPLGTVHGGALAALAEQVASQATLATVSVDGQIAVGQSNYTSFLRPVVDGTVRAEAIRLHRGRTSWLWDVRMSDDEGRLCALSRVTLAVRPRPDREE
jgi:1,4-dihydroxy-2-naphthoyl-CoA hydrolase